MTTKLRGLIAAMPIPLDAEDQFLPETFRLILKQAVREGINGFMVNGSMGMQPMLDLKTFEAVIDSAAQELEGGHKCLVVGCGDASYANTANKIKIAERYPIDFIALTSPYYFKYSDDQILDYIIRVAESTTHNIVLYDNPDCTHNPISVDVVRRAAELPNIKGIKCSRYDIHYIRILQEECSGADFAVINGVLHYMDLLQAEGIKGFVDGLWALTPRLAMQIYELGKKGDREGTRTALFKLIRFVEELDKYDLIAAYGAAMNVQGFPGVYGPCPYKAPDQKTIEGIRNYMLSEDLVEIESAQVVNS